MIIEIPTLIPILTLILGFAGLGFAIVRWAIDQKRIRQLISVNVASILEGIAGQCLSVTYDQGSWNARGGERFGIDNNETTISIPTIPIFSDIKSIEYLGRTHLNQLLALAPIHDTIRSYLTDVAEHDFGPYDDFFHDRCILYAGFGEYVSRLAREIRHQIDTPGLGKFANETGEKLKGQLVNLITASNEDKENIKDTYERVFLPVSESYWPKEADAQEKI